MSKLTSEEFTKLHTQAIKLSGLGLRLGQAYMVTLCGINNDLYDKVRNTENDCFYNDDKIKNLLNFLTNLIVSCLNF